MFTSTEIHACGTDDAQFETVYLARQPIILASGALAAYELLFRSGDGSYCPDIDGVAATANVIRNAFFGMGIQSVLSGAVGFINVDARFLCSELVEALQPRSVVLEILETVDSSPVLLSRLAELRRAGYRFALDDYTGELDRVRDFLPYVDVVKFDILAMPPETIEAAVAKLDRPTLRLLAEKVETTEQFEKAKRLGFSLFQGFHFARPESLKGRQARTPDETQLLNLISVLQKDQDDQEILDELKRHPTVAIKMLGIVNSSSMGLSRQIGSLADALRTLGRKQVLRIINVLLFAGKEAGGVLRNPLFQTACSRGRLLEMLVPYDEELTLEEQDGAFLIGMLSLVDGLLAQPMHMILSQLRLPEALSAALMSRQGRLGALLSLVENLEVANDAQVHQSLVRLPHLNGIDLARIQMEAFAWSGAMASTA